MSKKLKSLALLAVIFFLVSAAGDKDEMSEKPSVGNLLPAHSQ